MAIRHERPVPKRENEIAATYHSEVVTRKMMPDEYRRYFGCEPPVRKGRGKRA